MMKNLINRTARHRPKNFIAPVMSKHARLFVVQDNIPYWFDAKVEHPGWYYFNPNKTTREANEIRDAHPHEYMEYLSVLPSIYVIALFPINDATWLVMPYNISDAEQRGWNEGAPRFMHLVLDNISSLDVIRARMHSKTLIFDYLSGISGGNTKELAIAKDMFDKRLEVVRKIEAQKAAEEHRVNRLQTERGRMEESLAFMGAELEDWTREIDGYTVRWKIDGQVYRMQIDTNMRIESAGVCLNGTDDYHSLSSVVSVMQDRRKAIDDGDHGDY